MKSPLYRPPLPSTEFDGDATLCGSVLRFQYFRNDVLHRSGIRFQRVSAARTRAERCCTAWHVEEAYDTLVVVQGSTWLEDVLSDTQEVWRNKGEMHHYMIYLDSAGCFEIIAEAWSVIPEKAGAWPAMGE